MSNRTLLFIVLLILALLCPTVLLSLGGGDHSQKRLYDDANDDDDEGFGDQLDGHPHRSLVFRSCDQSQADGMSSEVVHVEECVTTGALCEPALVHCPDDEDKTWSEQSGCKYLLQGNNKSHRTISCKTSALMHTKSMTYFSASTPEPDTTNNRPTHIGTFIINPQKEDAPDLQNETLLHVTLKPFLIGLNNDVLELVCNITQLEYTTKQNHNDIDIKTLEQNLDLICNRTSNSCSIFCNPNVDITHSWCVSYASIQLINNGTKKPSLYIGCETVQTKSRESPSGRPITNILNGPVLVMIQTTGLVFLFLTFLTHCLFSELRTTPGINLMFLVSSLFVTHLVFLSGGTAVRTLAVCSAVGVLLHFSWLSSFAWMSVCSFHMYKVFRTIAPMSRCGNAADFNRICGYCLFAFGVPFLIVTATCIVNLVLSRGANIGYGRKYNVVCFVSFSDGAVLTFVVPILFNMFYTLFFLIRSCITFQKASKVRKYCRQRNMNMLSHSLRLSTLVGMSWLAGGLAVIIKREIIVYIFIILSSSHGVFLFFAFVCTKRVLGFYIHLFQRCNRRVNEPVDIDIELNRKY